MFQVNDQWFCEVVAALDTDEGIVWMMALVECDEWRTVATRLAGVDEIPNTERGCQEVTL